MSFIQHLNSTVVINSAIGAVLVIITSIMGQRVFEYGDHLAQIRSDVGHWRQEQLELRTHIRDFYRLTDSGKDFKIRDNQIADLQEKAKVLEQRVINLEQAAIQGNGTDFSRLLPFLLDPANP